MWSKNSSNAKNTYKKTAAKKTYLHLNCAELKRITKHRNHGDGARSYPTHTTCNKTTCDNQIHFFMRKKNWLNRAPGKLSSRHLFGKPCWISNLVFGAPWCILIRNRDGAVVATGGKQNLARMWLTKKHKTSHSRSRVVEMTQPKNLGISGTMSINLSICV